MVTNGTYVIRKGRKERQRLIDIDTFHTFAPPDIEGEPLKSEDDLDEETDDDIIDKVEVGSKPVPTYRHSIDLAIPTPSQFPAHSPR